MKAKIMKFWKRCAIGLATLMAVSLAPVEASAAQAPPLVTAALKANDYPPGDITSPPYLCGSPQPSDATVEILAAGNDIEPRGKLYWHANGNPTEITHTFDITEKETLGVETSVNTSLEISRVVGASRSVGVVTKVENEIAIKFGLMVKIPPRTVGYAQPYVQFARVAYKNTDHVARYNIMGTWWCINGTFISYRWAKIPTDSIICSWQSPPDTRCTRRMLQGGGGGYGQPPGSSTSGPTPGPTPVADVRGLADGTLLRTTDTGRIYKMVGGAPVWQATCNDNICNSTPRPTTQAVINAGPATPRNASSAVDQRGRVYLFVGGAPVWQDSCAAPVNCGNPVKISDWSIDARDHMNQEPADGTLVQARSDGTDLPVAATLGGALVPYNNAQEVIDTGHGGDWTSKVVIISGGSYNRLGFMPRNGTLIQGTGGGSSTPVAAIAGGARINFASAQEVIDAGHGTNWASKVRAVPARHFHAIPTVPYDGTLLQAPGTPVAAMVGGARINFASAQEIIDAGYGTNWTSKVQGVPARVFNALPTQIIDGTLIQASNGASPVAAIVGGAQVSFNSPQEVIDAGHGTNWTQKVQTVPARVFAALPTKIADGTRIGKSGSTSEAAVVGGAKIPFISGAERDEVGYGTRSLQKIPARVWDALPTKIADGTRIGKGETSTQGGIVGGAKVAFANTAELEAAGYSNKPLRRLPARVWDALPTQIADGTRIGKSG
ncbi:hypothetical protein, partial [Nonomuraea thailandensis]